MSLLQLYKNKTQLVIKRVTVKKLTSI